MKQIVIVLIFLSSITPVGYGQVNGGTVEGEVSFVTSTNTYVRFDSTEGIEKGDTLSLFMDGVFTPCLLVETRSSTSCVCVLLDNCESQIGGRVMSNALGRNEEKTGDSIVEEEIQKESQEQTPLYKERIKGRISAASYSNMSSIRDSRHRMMGRFSLNADHLSNSQWSLETYMNYRQLFLPASDTSLKQTSFFNVYNLAIRYDFDTTLSVVIGRKINQKVSSLGAIDGVQAEKYWGNFFMGVLGGFKPDLADYGLNTNLGQLGAYFGKEINTVSLRSNSTFGILQQNNGAFVDRRYVYFQHSTTVNGNLNVFSSVEWDVYNGSDSAVSKKTRLTNLYLSSRYRFNKKLSLFVSYDSRKRVIFYESFRQMDTNILQILSNDENRQGLRLRFNVKPTKHLRFGGGFSNRFQGGKLNKSNNINTYMNVSRLPNLPGRFNVNFNLNVSSYLLSRTITFRYSTQLVNEKINADFYTRFVGYDLKNGSSDTGSSSKFSQKYLGASLSYRINKSFTFSVLSEVALMQTETNFRINTRIIKRFGKK